MEVLLHHVSYADVYFHLENGETKQTLRLRAHRERLERVCKKVCAFLDQDLVNENEGDDIRAKNCTTKLWRGDTGEQDKQRSPKSMASPRPGFAQHRDSKNNASKDSNRVSPTSEQGGTLAVVGLGGGGVDNNNRQFSADSSADSSADEQEVFQDVAPEDAADHVEQQNDPTRPPSSYPSERESSTRELGASLVRPSLEDVAGWSRSTGNKMNNSNPPDGSGSTLGSFQLASLPTSPLDEQVHSGAPASFVQRSSSTSTQVQVGQANPDNTSDICIGFDLQGMDQPFYNHASTQDSMTINLDGGNTTNSNGAVLTSALSGAGVTSSLPQLSKNSASSPTPAPACAATNMPMAATASSTTTKTTISLQLLAEAFFDGDAEHAKKFKLNAIVFPVFALAVESWLESILVRRGGCDFLKIYFLSGSHQRTKRSETFTTESAARCLVRFAERVLKTRFFAAATHSNASSVRNSAHSTTTENTKVVPPKWLRDSTSSRLDALNICLRCIHSGPGVFLYDENVRFMNNECLPYLDSDRQQCVQYFQKHFPHRDWAQEFAVSFILAEGAPARVSAITQSLHQFRPNYVHILRPKSYRDEPFLRADGVQALPFDKASVAPAIPINGHFVSSLNLFFQQGAGTSGNMVMSPGGGMHNRSLLQQRERTYTGVAELDNRIRLVLKEMLAHKKAVEQLGSSRDAELAGFWLRKTRKPVLCVLMVEKEEEVQVVNSSQQKLAKVRKFYRGLNLEVSMPTGSLCAERNCIGQAVAADPTLRREHIKLVAVLSLPQIGSGASSSSAANVNKMSNPHFAGAATTSILSDALLSPTFQPMNSGGVSGAMNGYGIPGMQALSSDTTGNAAASRVVGSYNNHDSELAKLAPETPPHPPARTQHSSRTATLLSSENETDVQLRGLDTTSAEEEQDEQGEAKVKIAPLAAPTNDTATATAGTRTIENTQLLEQAKGLIEKQNETSSRLVTMKPPPGGDHGGPPSYAAPVKLAETSTPAGGAHLQEQTATTLQMSTSILSTSSTTSNNKSPQLRGLDQNDSSQTQSPRQMEQAQQHHVVQLPQQHLVPSHLVLHPELEDLGRVGDVGVGTFGGSSGQNNRAAEDLGSVPVEDLDSPMSNSYSTSVNLNGGGFSIHPEDNHYNTTPHQLPLQEQGVLSPVSAAATGASANFMMMNTTVLNKIGATSTTPLSGGPPTSSINQPTSTTSRYRMSSANMMSPSQLQSSTFLLDDVDETKQTSAGATTSTFTPGPRSSAGQASLQDSAVEQMAPSAGGVTSSSSKLVPARSSFASTSTTSRGGYNSAASPSLWGSGANQPCNHRKMSGDLNPINPCGACMEWLRKISEKEPSFRVITFDSYECEAIYVKRIDQLS
ncbi:unnamed protein product [Amoebophrya sp. A120]|nr:unnamed protein product [Amoebophrya sp. A120]|eukprot:GSA120T00020983001.1